MSLKVNKSAFYVLDRTLTANSLRQIKVVNRKKNTSTPTKTVNSNQNAVYSVLG